MCQQITHLSLTKLGVNLTGFQLAQREPYSFILHTTTVTVPIFYSLKQICCSKPQEGNIITQHLLQGPALPWRVLSHSTTTNQVSSARLLLRDHDSPLGRTGTGSCFHQNGSAVVCQGEQKLFTVTPECGRKVKVHNTYSFGSLWIVSPQRLTPSQPIWFDYAGTKCVSVIQETLIF